MPQFSVITVVIIAVYHYSKYFATSCDHNKGGEVIHKTQIFLKIVPMTTTGLPAPMDSVSHTTCCVMVYDNVKMGQMKWSCVVGNHIQ